MTLNASCLIESRILTGDCREMLRTLADESVQCVVTSPPFWALRAYGTSPQIWGGSSDCEHEWETQRYYTEKSAGTASSAAFHEAGPENAERLKQARWREDDTCRLCGAWRGELGLEPSPNLYVEHIVEVFREVRRVLRSDGVLWCNLGDSFATHARGHVGFGSSTLDLAAVEHQRVKAEHRSGRGNNRAAGSYGLKDKDLVGIPWMAAFALRTDGWYLRSDVIWAKKACMPESVTDRPTRSHEHVFLLTKRPTYFYDAEAIREDAVAGWRGSSFTSGKTALDGEKVGLGMGERNERGSRNRRDVWHLGPEPSRDAHYAVMPSKLVEPCILAGTAPGDTVLDPFAGSGTTLAVAKRLGRSAIGIELNPEYVALCHKRLNAITTPLPLYTGEETA